MKKRFLTICSMVMVLCFLFPSISAFATNSTIKDLQQKQKDAASKASEAHSNLNQTKYLKDSAQKELDAIEEEMRTAAEQLDNITAELDKKTAELEEAEIDLEKTQIARDKQFESFRDRSRYIYMNGSASYIDVILNSKSITDLIKRIDYVNRIVEYDKNLISQLKASEEAISTHVEKAQKQKDDHEVLLMLQQEKMNKYEDSVAQKEKLLIALHDDETTYSQLASEWDAASKDFEKLIKAAQEEEDRKRIAAQAAANAAAAAAAKAKAAQASAVVYSPDGNPLQWPLPGNSRITSPYGNRPNPFNSKKTEFHTGVDVGASYGTNIVAAEAGTVTYSGWQRGYGNTVIINHGNGMTTLYAHASSLLVSVGQSVRRGQAIAKVGSTGNSTGNHLHFEVRVNSSHTNPMKYTKPQ